MPFISWNTPTPRIFPCRLAITSPDSARSSARCPSVHDVTAANARARRSGIISSALSPPRSACRSTNCRANPTSVRSGATTPRRSFILGRTTQSNIRHSASDSASIVAHTMPTSMSPTSPASHAERSSGGIDLSSASTSNCLGLPRHSARASSARSAFARSGEMSNPPSGRWRYTSDHSRLRSIHPCAESPSMCSITLSASRCSENVISRALWMGKCTAARRTMSSSFRGGISLRSSSSATARAVPTSLSPRSSSRLFSAALANAAASISSSIFLASSESRGALNECLRDSVRLNVFTATSSAFFSLAATSSFSSSSSDFKGALNECARENFFERVFVSFGFPSPGSPSLEREVKVNPA
mmetsp:Transcript_66579/g.210767  ORF Transcript_66579/g.210767 Transcript_66579/m.210767 type:complete len:359 (+) Transcript_66579:2452-3528(+)